MVVEDSEPLRKVLAEKMTDEGFEVFEASGGEEGFKLAQEHHPDVVVTDIVMFPVDGLEMARQIRSLGAYGKDVPIFALSNQNSAEEEARVKAVNLTAYMVKSDTSLDKVVEEVKKLFKGKKK